jgi:hypothetical protein
LKKQKLFLYNLLIPKGNTARQKVRKSNSFLCIYKIFKKRK